MTTHIERYIETVKGNDDSAEFELSHNTQTVERFESEMDDYFDNPRAVRWAHLTEVQRSGHGKFILTDKHGTTFVWTKVRIAVEVE